jgi:hypothetical protein
MKRIMSLFLVTTLAVALAACAGSTGAGLQKDGAAFDSFMGRKVLSGYRYYTTGPENTPDAIVGMKKGYTLAGDKWTERKMTTELLDSLVKQMNDMYGAVSVGLSGSNILDDTGKPIGVWYSAISTTQVEMLSPTEVSIEPPGQIFLDQLKVRMRG